MSFQHFRLGDLALHQPQLHSDIHPTAVHHQQQHQPHHQHIPSQAIPGQSQFSIQIENPITTFSVSLKKQPNQQQQQSQPPPQQQAAKQPYGAGDADDGYTLVFANLQEFNKWRQAEEERTMCEFVKGDTHGSKAVPPRFKDHTKLVCARHSRSGRKKYIKKHPERIRKVPSRKLEVGCPASISYKTYFDSEQVRACYVSQHSHDTGLANLPYTRRGRRQAAVKAEKEKIKSAKPQEINTISATTSGPSASSPPSAMNDQSNPPSTNASPQPAPAVPPSTPGSFATAVSMLAPLPPQNSYTVPSPQTYTYASPIPQQPAYPPSLQPVPVPAPVNLSHDRWDNMATLFQAVREHARSFEYPSPSVAALETILIRLYLESPVGMGAQPGNVGSIMPTVMAHARGATNAPAAPQTGSNVAGGSTNNITNGSTTEDSG